MEMKTAISCTILRHTKILIAVGVCIISLATLGSKNHTTNITKIVTQSIGIIIKRSEERFSRNAETDLVCRLLLEKKKTARHHHLLHTHPPLPLTVSRRPRPARLQEL